MLDRHGHFRAARLVELVLRSGVVLIVRVIGIGLVFNAPSARALGAAGLGISHLALTFTLIASMVGQKGLDGAMRKVGTTNCVAEDGKPQVGAPFIQSAALPTTAARLTSGNSGISRN